MLHTNWNIDADVNHRLKAGWTTRRQVSGAWCDKRPAFHTQRPKHRRELVVCVMSSESSYNNNKFQQKKISLLQFFSTTALYYNVHSTFAMLTLKQRAHTNGHINYVSTRTMRCHHQQSLSDKIAVACCNQQSLNILLK